MSLNIALLDVDLHRDEGYRTSLYPDSKGNQTIGIGHKCSAAEIERFKDGIDPSQIMALYQNDRDYAIHSLDMNAEWWRGCGDSAQRGLVNMCFNMGWGHLQGFHKMLAALEAGDYITAAREALDSQWAAQVGDRAKRIADLFVSCAKDNLNA